MARRINQTEVKVLRDKMVAQGAGYCPLCLRPFEKVGEKNVVLDHCHVSGFVREPLCRNCNGMEGRVLHYAQRGALSGNSAEEWIKRLVAYWNKHEKPQTPYIHYTHKTEDEKREHRNKQQRIRRARASSGKRDS